MAFDQSSILKDLWPLNVAQNIAEEPLVLPASSTGRTVECYPPNSARDVGSPGSVPLFYPAPVSDASVVGIGYGNAVSCASVQCSAAGVPIAHTAIIPAVRFNYGPNFGLGGNAPGHTTFMATGPGYASNLGNLVGGNGLDKAVSYAANGINYGASQGSRIIGNASDQAGSLLPSGSNYSPTIGHRAESSGVYQASEEGDDSLSGRKVKFLCSYGGRILPRPSDGMLRYVGGVTRIISFKRDVSFKEMAQKMADTYGQPVVIKYQLPDEDLDALVSVSCPDDLENMMDEYGRLVEGSADGSSKLRVFLFSASELDSSNVGQFGDVNDSGQGYVDAVNGINDGITWKESITSETSTQNSDFSGSEALGNYPMPGHGDISGALSSCMLSPKENVAASHDTATKLVGIDHGPIYSDAFAIPLGLPAPNSGPTQTTPFQNEVELDRSVPPTLSQQQFLLQQSIINIPPVAPCLQPSVDPHQEVTNHSDYVQLPPQMGLPNPAFLGRAPPVFTPQQLYDKNPGLPSQQVIPSMQITMAPPTSHVAVRPDIIQPLMQPQKKLMDYESTLGPRIMQVPIEHSYDAYQVRVPSAVVAGNFGWVQVQPKEQVIFSDGLSPHQQVMIPDKIQKLEDCYMCQKTLPHAHSDPVAVVQDQPDGGASPVSDSILSFHSLPMEDVLKSQATNQGEVTTPSNEVIIGQGVDIRSKVISKVEPLVGAPCTDTTGLPQNYEPQQGERTFTQKSDGFSHLPNAVLQEVIGRAGDKHSKLPVENWIEQDLLVNKPIINDMCPVSTTAVETSECMVPESPKEYTNELACIVSKEDAVDNWVISNHLRATDERIDALGVYNPESYVDNDHCKLPVDKPNENHIMDHKTQLPVEKEMLLDNNFGKSNMVLDSDQTNMTDMLSCSYTKISYGHDSRPVGCIEMAQPPFWGISESNPQLKTGHHHKDDTVPSSLSPSGRCGDVQDSSNSLFSNQDPWNIHHDTYHPPPRPNKVALKKENYLSKDHFGENTPVNYDEQSLEAQLEGSLYQPFKQNLSLERGLAEDPIIRQELKAVAEGVAASVLHSSSPSNPDLHTGDTPSEEDIEEGNFEDKAQDVKTKPPENRNLGFPISDGLGRLQVIKNCDLEELRELGSGTFGTVYHGKWRGSNVAIKRINDRCFCGKPSEQDRMRADFWNEAIKLADLHHPNVLAFYGVVFDGPGGTVATVTEYMVNGSLRNALQKNERILDMRKRLLIAMDVAFGLEYLHGKNIVHFDLKSDNLLVNLRDPHRPICKVGDLGLSKAKRQTLISGGVRGTLPWMAPELLNGSSSLVSEKVDVFSFGIVMWELLTGEEPYADLFYGAIIGGIVSNTLRPKVPESCNPEWRWLMERCWSSEPSERPSFTEIADELRLMAAKSPRRGQHQQQQSPSSQPHVQK